jgi:hypothetical protein
MKRSTVRREAHAVQGHAVFCTRSLLAAFLVLSVLAGCNSSGKYPVRGKVTDKQGQPIPGLEGSQIVFEGASTSSVGEIAADGSFTLFTDRPGDGVPPGEYQVYIPRRRIDPEREAPQAGLQQVLQRLSSPQRWRQQDDEQQLVLQPQPL